MGIFDSIQDLIGGLGGDAQDALNNAKDNLPIDEITNAGGDLSDAATNASEEATNKVDDIKNSLGL